MKRISLSATILVLFAASMFFTLCRKNETKDSRGTKHSPTAQKVTAWLDSKKKATQPNKVATIETLKANLDFTASRFEKLNDESQFFYVPLRKEFKELKNVDEKSTPFLLVVLDKSGNIKDGNLILYTPANGNAPDIIPDQTFHKVYNNKPIDCSGNFRFLSVTGTLLYDLGFKDGTANSFGKLEKRDAPGGVQTCIAWFFVTTYYDADGNVLYETEAYIGTTCYGDAGCDDPNLQSLCQEDVGGSGGGTGANDCCIPNQDIQWTSSAGAGVADVTCGLVGAAPNGTPIRKCRFKWEFFSNSLLFWNWTYCVWVEADFEKIGGLWQFKEVKPVSSVFTEGQTPPCVNFTCTVSDMNSISADKSQARIDLYYNISFTVPCLPNSGAGAPRTGTMSQNWSAPQQ